jgi:hypothetical protein
MGTTYDGGSSFATGSQEMARWFVRVLLAIAAPLAIESMACLRARRLASCSCTLAAPSELDDVAKYLTDAGRATLRLDWRRRGSPISADIDTRAMLV